MLGIVPFPVAALLDEQKAILAAIAIRPALWVKEAVVAGDFAGAKNLIGSCRLVAE